MTSSESPPSKLSGLRSSVTANTIQTNSIKVTVHSKKCSVNQTCNVEIFKSRIQEELVASILREATILEKQKKK